MPKLRQLQAWAHTRFARVGAKAKPCECYVVLKREINRMLPDRLAT